nr:hypothetical protein CFP56_62862 [Quercus suber]
MLPRRLTPGLPLVTAVLFLLLLPIISAQNLTSQINDIPSCALNCFVSAIQNTTCAISDFYCQCTAGRAVITEDVMQCLCGTTCDSDDLFAIEQGTLKICSEALSASSQTYSAPPITSIACQGLSATGSMPVTTTTAEADAADGSTGLAAPFPTAAPLLAGACLGIAGWAAACGL